MTVSRSRWEQVRSAKNKEQIRQYMADNYGRGEMQDRIGEVEGVMAEFK